MSDHSVPPPQYTLWECMQVCIALSKRALEEVRALSRIPGPEGKEGPQGKQGPQGVPGPEGAVGPVGREGQKGEQGTNGRDGLGWDSLEKIDDENEYGIRVVQDGTVIEEYRWAKPQAKTLADCYKRVWKEGLSYQRSDVVTFGGSAFLAMKDTTDKPETSDSWVLWVKRGRDGKDGKSLKGDRGDKGEKGDVGPRGYSG